MRAAPLLGLLALALVAGCAAPEGDPAPSFTREGTQEIPVDGFFVPAFRVPVAALVRVTIEVAEALPVDAYVAQEEVCAKWGTRAFVPEAKALRIVNGSFEVVLPAGQHCLAIDNARFAFGEAEPERDVTVKYRLDAWDRDP